MHVWIIRHGKAEKDSPTGLDADRRLRPRGERQAAHLGAEFAGRDDAPRLLLTSPFVRARQTAEGIAEVGGQPVEIVDSLESGRGALSYLGVVRERAGTAPDQTFALVGHNPEVTQCLGALARSETTIDAVRTGMAVLIEIENGFEDAFESWGGAVVDVIRLDED